MKTTPTNDTTELRAKFAERLSLLYGTEVPAYTTLLAVSREVNDRVLLTHGAGAESLGSIERVTAERHGAIRVGTPLELAAVARIFAALGMHPCGFYDLRDAKPRPIPVISTAFRPLQRDELAKNPFRVFTSMLVPQDRRFFDADTEHRLQNFLDARQLFPDELLALADRAVEFGGLDRESTNSFLDLAAAAFALSSDPVDRAWYEELERISDVAADIGGVSSTHINHLTPRVLDIDDLYVSMRERGIEMIDAIQGPPRWHGPDVLLRQTSFRALSEARRFRNADGSVTDGELRVRFGEVEARGIALTPAGRDLYAQLVDEVDRRMNADPSADRQSIAERVWTEGMPATETDLCLRGIGLFTYAPAPNPSRPPTVEERHALALGDVAPLVRAGIVQPEPIVYEDFLPRSAAGIFASNLSGAGHIDTDQGGAERDIDWLSDRLGMRVVDPADIYAAEVADSVAAVQQKMNG